MAKPREKPMTKKPPAGPHALTKAAEARETRAQEKSESPAFEREERRRGIEGKYDYGKGKKSGKR